MASTDPCPKCVWRFDLLRAALLWHSPAGLVEVVHRHHVQSAMSSLYSCVRARFALRLHSVMTSLHARVRERSWRFRKFAQVATFLAFVRILQLTPPHPAPCRALTREHNHFHAVQYVCGLLWLGRWGSPSPVHTPVTPPCTPCPAIMCHSPPTVATGLGWLMLVIANGMPNWSHDYDDLSKESHKWGPWEICCSGTNGGCAKCACSCQPACCTPSPSCWVVTLAWETCAEHSLLQGWHISLLGSHAA